MLTSVTLVCMRLESLHGLAHELRVSQEPEIHFSHVVTTVKQDPMTSGFRCCPPAVSQKTRRRSRYESSCRARPRYPQMECARCGDLCGNGHFSPLFVATSLCRHRLCIHITSAPMSTATPTRPR